MPDDDQPGATVATALVAVDRIWLSQPGGRQSDRQQDSQRSVASTAVSLATADLPTGTTERARRTRAEYHGRLRDVLDSLASTQSDCLDGGTVATLDSALESIDPADPTTVPELALLGGLVAEASVVVTAAVEYGVCLADAAGPLDAAVTALSAGRHEAALDRGATTATALSSMAPLAARADRITAAVASLQLPAHADLTPFSRAVRTALSDGDGEHLDELADRVRRARDAAWTRSDLRAPTPDEFEDLVAHCWRLAAETGVVARTRRSDDGGVDVVARFANGDVSVVQVKQHGPENPVGRPTVQQTVGAMSQFDADRAAVVTTSRFTDPARDAARALDSMRLVDGDRLLALVNESALVAPRALAGE